jgi:hypothetical protein
MEIAGILFITELLNLIFDFFSTFWIIFNSELVYTNLPRNMWNFSAHSSNIQYLHFHRKCLHHAHKCTKYSTQFIIVDAHGFWTLSTVRFENHPTADCQGLSEIHFCIFLFLSCECLIEAWQSGKKLRNWYKRLICSPCPQDVKNVFVMWWFYFEETKSWQLTGHT